MIIIKLPQIVIHGNQEHFASWKLKLVYLQYQSMRMSFPHDIHQLQMVYHTNN